MLKPGQRERRSHVLGSDGSPLTLSNLPESRHVRWVVRRKAEIVLAISGGLLTLDDACARYHISPEEIMAWQLCYASYGLPGLRAAKARHVRPQ